MKSNLPFRLLLLTLILTLVLCLTSAWAEETKQSTPAAAEVKSSTLINLLIAYNGESNASARYTAFAAKADSEGYLQVAVLFRAAAKAEEIHARNHAEVIKRMKGEPKVEIATPEVKSTRENLEAALKGETYEKDTMYPDFLKLAREDKNSDAVRSLNFAKNVEAEHAKFYAEALADLDAWKTVTKEFYVCTICGNTVTKLDFEKCSICFNPKEKFIKIS
jgi:rubrerythrin